MLTKSRAIVLKNTFFGDHSVISKMYTREHGIRSYMLNGVRKPRSKISMAMLQPLNLLTIDAYEKEQAGLQRIKELKCQPLLLDIQDDFRKRSVAMFLIELLNACLQAEDCEYELFDFLEDAIIQLDQSGQVSNFPLQFMVGLSNQLGIAPQADYSSERPYLNIETASYSSMKGDHCAAADVSQVLHHLINQTNEGHLSISPELRKRSLETFIQYYQYHIMHQKTFRSMDILSEVLDAWHKV